MDSGHPDAKPQLQSLNLQLRAVAVKWLLPLMEEMLRPLHCNSQGIGHVGWCKISSIRDMIIAKKSPCTRTSADINLVDTNEPAGPHPRSHSGNGIRYLGSSRNSCLPPHFYPGPEIRAMDIIHV